MEYKEINLTNKEYKEVKKVLKALRTLAKYDSQFTPTGFDYHNHYFVVKYGPSTMFGPFTGSISISMKEV